MRSGASAFASDRSVTTTREWPFGIASIVGCEWVEYMSLEALLSAPTRQGREKHCLTGR
ncbi:hypothetical protein GCM10009037_17360 [Halarchaeum grantii]|uniref:Uncharacterized protein n=1 Tax=Halarchaeum grantii TaxID=1193105 RepID=A0A830F308_9EURY|nr:hypothetical protein GCM10009037_17360 [Halarchaeum grantii]